MARPSPTCSRICSTCSSTMFAGVHVGVDARDVVQEPAQDLLAVRGVPAPRGGTARRRAAGRFSKAATGAPALLGDHVEALRGLGDRVAVAHPHRLVGRQVLVQLPAVGRQFGAAVLTGAGVGDHAAEGLGHRLEAVADAEDRDARSNRAGSTCGALSAYTLDGPPDSTMAAGSLATSSATVAVCGTTSEYTWPRAPGARSAGRTARRSRRRARVGAMLIPPDQCSWQGLRPTGSVFSCSPGCARSDGGNIVIITSE